MKRVICWILGHQPSVTWPMIFTSSLGVGLVTSYRPCKRCGQHITK